MGKTFSNMSIPQLELTLEALELLKQRKFSNITKMDKEEALDSDLKKESDALCMVNEMMTAVEVEIFNQKQDR